MRDLNDVDFEDEVLRCARPVMVVFWADWSGACHIMTSIADQLAAEFSGEVEVCRIDIEQNPRTPIEYGIHSVPALLFFDNGNVIDHVLGITPKKELAEKLGALVRGE